MRVPELLDRNADEDEEKSDADNPGHDKAPDGPGHLFEIWNSEDAVVHEEQAQLGPAKIEGVENLGNNKPFSHHDDVLWSDEVGVNTHSARVHGKDEADNNEIPALLTR